MNKIVYSIGLVVIVMIVGSTVGGPVKEEATFVGSSVLDEVPLIDG